MMPWLTIHPVYEMCDWFWGRRFPLQLGIMLVLLLFMTLVLHCNRISRRFRKFLPYLVHAIITKYKKCHAIVGPIHDNRLKEKKGCPLYSLSCLCVLLTLHSYDVTIWRHEFKKCRQCFWSDILSDYQCITYTGVSRLRVSQHRCSPLSGEN